MKKNLLFMTVFIGMLFASCSVQENARLVFFNYRGQGISQDLEPIQPGEAVKKEISFGRTGFYKPFFDSKTNEIYLVFNFRKEGVLFNSDGLIYKLDNNGNIMQFYTYRFKRNDEIFGSYIYGINDSIVLAGSSNNQYELFHIDDGFIEFLDIENALNESYPIDFKNNRIFFLNGFYDCTLKKFSHYPEKWNITEIYRDRIVGKQNAYPRVSSDGKKLIARNENGNIIIFDFDTNESFDTGIKRDCDKYLHYEGRLLYFLENEKLYFSKDTFSSKHSLSRYFDKNSVYPFLIWHRYNIKTGELTEIKAPKGTFYPEKHIN